MLVIKSTKEEHLISAIRSCRLTRKRRPNVVRIITLEEALKTLPISLVAKEVAFTITRPLVDRLTKDHYIIAYRSTVLKSWNNVAVVCRGKKKVQKFSDITCVKCDNPYETENDLFNNLLLNELNIIRRV